MIAVEASCKGDGQMEIEEGGWWCGAQEGALFAFGLAPGGIGGRGDRADLVRGVVAGQERGEASIGGGEGTDLFVTEESGEAVLKMAEAAFDFAFGLGIGSHPMVDAQAEEGALELAAGLGFRLCAGGAEEAQGVGIDGGRKPVEFEGETEMTEVVPSGVRSHETSADDFTGVIVFGENESLFLAGWPPLMDGAVVLPEFTDVGALPAPALARLGSAVFEEIGKVSTQVAGDCATRAVKSKAPSEFVGDQSAVERLAVWNKGSEEIEDIQGPRLAMVASGGLWDKTGALLPPLGAELVEPSASDAEMLLSGQGVDLAVIEGGENFPHHLGRNTMSDLWLFIRPS